MMIDPSVGSSSSSILPNVYSLGYRFGQLLAETFDSIQGSIDNNNKSNDDYGNNADTATNSATTISSFFMLNQDHNINSLLLYITSFPALYKDWWIRLYANDPVHVYVETTLLIAIVYFLVCRSGGKKVRTSNSDQLTPTEEEELLYEWKHCIRQPLAPPLPNNNDGKDDNKDDFINSNSNSVIVHKNNSRFLEIETNNGQRQTVLNFATYDFLGMASDDPIATICGDKNTEAPKHSEEITQNNIRTLNSITNPMKRAALQALDRYGCGSCGPRGFYGTVDVHLQLEQAFANYMKASAGILYSDAASTITSTIAAFCKRGDLVVVDEACYEPVLTGVQLSRANIQWFRHNDMDDLHAVLRKNYESDVQLGRQLNAQRRFIIVEGLYKNTGSICPLDEVVELKNKYHYRLILDESHSFGTIGETGRGCMELHNRKAMDDVEIVTVSMENAIGGIGGITIGSDEVVDHQRLSGAGYCYSASSPPFTAAAAIEALNVLERYNEQFMNRLNNNRVYMYQQLSNRLSEQFQELLLITSDIRSPIIVLQFADNVLREPEEEEELHDNDLYDSLYDESLLLQQIVNECLYTNGVAFVATGPKLLSIQNQQPLLQYARLNTGSSSPGNHSNTTNNLHPDPPTAGIRITVSAAHTEQDIDHAVAGLCDAVSLVMNRWYNSHDNTTHAEKSE